jgi:hypothetical protein
MRPILSRKLLKTAIFLRNLKAASRTDRHAAAVAQFCHRSVDPQTILANRSAKLTYSIWVSLWRGTSRTIRLDGSRHEQASKNGHRPSGARRRVGGDDGLILSVILSALQAISRHRRQRITRHGEGVIGVSFQSQGPLLISPTPQWWVDFSGEAFPIDLGARGTLFVLLAGDPKRQEPESHRDDHHYSPDAGQAALVEYFKFYVSGLPNGFGAKFKIDDFANSRTGVDLAPNSLPKLVYFRDVDDPKSAELVDPYHLDASFGPGVTILRAKAEITGEPITSGIEKRLKWVKNPAVMKGPGWQDLPEPARVIITGLFTGTPEEHFK